MTIEPKKEKTGTAAARLARIIWSITFDDLPAPTRHSALRCILDLIACAAAGRGSASVSGVVANGAHWASNTFQKGNASVWFNGMSLSAPGAAFVNSLSASVLDVDDGHRAASGHPGAAIIPAVIAVAEAIEARWQDVVIAIACGYEAGVRVAAARDPASQSSAATGRWSAVAVAAAVGKLCGLTPDKLTDAVAIAEAQAPNMMAADHAGFAGSHTKEGIPWSVLTGIAGTEQAALGMRGYRRGLDNPIVYREALIARPNPNGYIIQTAYFKPYACCRWIHSAIDAALRLRDNGLDPSTIEKIEVATFRKALSLENATKPDDIISAQFSIPFVVAVALLEGANALLPMSPELLERADVIEVAARITLQLAPDLDACFPAQVPARVTITSRAGIFRAEVFNPRGDPSNSLSDSELIEKAVCLCTGVVMEAQVREFAADLLSMSVRQLWNEPVNRTLTLIRQGVAQNASL